MFSRPVIFKRCTNRQYAMASNFKPPRDADSPGSARRQHQWSVAVPSMPAAKISKMVRGVDT